jgi:hypothetical protein
MCGDGCGCRRHEAPSIPTSRPLLPLGASDEKRPALRVEIALGGLDERHYP